MLNLDSDGESKLSHKIISLTFELPVFKREHTDIYKWGLFLLLFLSSIELF